MQFYMYMPEIQLDTFGSFAASRNHDTVLADEKLRWKFV